MVVAVLYYCSSFRGQRQLDRIAVLVILLTAAAPPLYVVIDVKAFIHFADTSLPLRCAANFYRQRYSAIALAVKTKPSCLRTKQGYALVPEHRGLAAEHYIHLIRTRLALS